MVYLSKLSRRDVPRMMFWGKHKDPRFYHYNFDVTTEAGFDFWFKSKRQIFQRRIYKVEDEDRNMVGFITIKNIQWFSRQAEMGIVFDPNILDKGYGTAGIYAMFEEYFDVMKMQTLTLRVATFNQRALHTYLKCGFEIQDKRLEAFEFQQINKILMTTSEDFDDFDGVLHTYYYHMSISRRQYEAKKSK